ncbi:MAG: glycosyltransferase family 2 protein, partial [Alphaproteobacteria bacterium]|nr:glycosyltransferase family 2 protein [Alphaproteobacteria bacterium]
MTDIKVSVLTSLYKHKPEYVRQCLDSLVEQTLRECEFILIDNGADENNKALIKEYLEKDARFKAIYLDTNIG